MSIAEILDRITWAFVSLIYAALHYPIQWEFVFTVVIIIGVALIITKILKEIFNDTLREFRELRYNRNFSNIANVATIIVCWALLITPFIIWIVAI